MDDACPVDRNDRFTPDSCGSSVSNNRCGTFLRDVTDSKVEKLLVGFAACEKESGPTAEYAEFVISKGEAGHYFRRLAAQCEIDRDLR